MDTPKRKTRRKRKPKQVQNLIDAGQPTQFRKGVSGLLLKKGVKKATEEFLKLSLDYVVPEEWKVNGMQIFKGMKITFSQILTFRMLHSATTGTRNPGLKDLQEVLNRVLGREPTVIKHGEAEPDDDFEGMSGEELIQLALSINQSIQRKALPAPKEDDAATQEESTSDAGQPDADKA